MIFIQKKQLTNFRGFLYSFKSDFERMKFLLAFLIAAPLVWSWLAWLLYDYNPESLFPLYAYFVGGLIYFTLTFSSIRYGGILRYIFIGLSIIGLFILHPKLSVLSIQEFDNSVANFLKIGIYGACGIMILVGAFFIIKDLFGKIKQTILKAKTND